MSNNPLKHLIDLVKFDSQFIQLERQKKQFEDQLADLDTQFKNNQHTLEVVKQKVTNQRKELDQNELRAKTLDAQETDKKQKIETVTNQKQYQSLKSEIAILKEQQRVLEDAVIASWNSFDNAKKELEVATVKTESVLETLEKQQQEKREQLTGVTNQIDALNSQRTEHEKDIPAEWLEKYAMMRSRVPDPVVPVLDGSCSACFYHLPGQDMIRLSKKTLIECKNCFRFIYQEQPTV